MTTKHIFNFVLPWHRLYATKDIAMIKKLKLLSYNTKK